MYEFYLPVSTGTITGYYDAHALSLATRLSLIREPLRLQQGNREGIFDDSGVRVASGTPRAEFDLRGRNTEPLRVV
jgi:hypothetical protein